MQLGRKAESTVTTLETEGADIFEDWLIAGISQSIMTLNEPKYAMLGNLGVSVVESSSPGLMPAALMQIKVRAIGEMVPLSLGSNPYLIIN